MIKWVGTLASIAGAFLVAFGVMLAGYSAFLVGSISWLAVGVITRDKPLIVLNGTFFVANIIGFVRIVL